MQRGCFVEFLVEAKGFLSNQREKSMRLTCEQEHPTSTTEGVMRCFGLCLYFRSRGVRLPLLPAHLSECFMK